MTIEPIYYQDGPLEYVVGYKITTEVAVLDDNGRKVGSRGAVVETDRDFDITHTGDLEDYQVDQIRRAL